MHRITPKTNVLRYVHSKRGETYFAMEQNPLNGETMYWFGHFVSMWYGKADAQKLWKSIEQNCEIIK